MLKFDPGLLDSAIHAMDEGVGVFNSEGLLVACNARYISVQQSLGASVRLGMSWRDIVAAEPRHGKISGTQDQEAARIRQRCKPRGAYSAIRETPGGHVYKVNERRIAGGGFVAVWTEVTELLHADAGASAPAADPGASLTERQREVIQLLVLGHSMKAIGRILGITSRTVAFHKYHAMAANGLSSNVDLLRFATAQGLLPAALGSDATGHAPQTTDVDPSARPADDDLCQQVN